MRESEMLELVIDSFRQVATEQQLGLASEPGPDTPLMGPDALFDSLGLVSVVLAVEEAIEDRHGVSITLASARALSEEHSPFRSVGSLSDYALRLVEEQHDGP